MEIYLGEVCSFYISPFNDHLSLSAAIMLNAVAANLLIPFKHSNSLPCICDFVEQPVGILGAGVKEGLHFINTENCREPASWSLSGGKAVSSK